MLVIRSNSWIVWSICSLDRDWTFSIWEEVSETMQRGFYDSWTRKLQTLASNLKFYTTARVRENNWKQIQTMLCESKRTIVKSVKMLACRLRQIIIFTASFERLRSIPDTCLFSSDTITAFQFVASLEATKLPISMIIDSWIINSIRLVLPNPIWRVNHIVPNGSPIIAAYWHIPYQIKNSENAHANQLFDISANFGF